MTNRDRAIKRAYEAGYLAGYNRGDMMHGLPYDMSDRERSFNDWATDNDHLLDGVPDHEARIKELEAKIQELESTSNYLGRRIDEHEGLA